MGAMGAGESASVNQHGRCRVSSVALRSTCLSQQDLCGPSLLDSVIEAVTGIGIVMSLDQRGFWTRSSAWLCLRWPAGSLGGAECIPIGGCERDGLDAVWVVDSCHAGGVLLLQPAILLPALSLQVSSPILWGACLTGTDPTLADHMYVNLQALLHRVVASGL